MRARALLLIALGASACTNFEDPTTVIDLRLLAVKVEPSEIILDADLSDASMPVVDPANNPLVKVTPLIVDPAGGGRMVTYTIRACPNDPFAPAAPGGGQGGGAFPSGGARTTVGSALCDESSPSTWTVPGSFDAGTSASVHPTIDQLSDAFMKDVFPDQYGNLHGGFDLGMPLTLDITIDAGTEQIRGIKRVLYWLQRIDPLQVPNQIPVIDAVTAYYDRDPGTLAPIDDPVLMVQEDPVLVVDAGKRSIWMEPARAIAEPFETTVIDPDTHHAVPLSVPRETLRYRFFASAGSFSPATTSSEPPTGFVAKGPIHIESEYRLPTADKVVVEGNGTALVTIWIVVRDDRGGESWVTRQLRITPL